MLTMPQQWGGAGKTWIKGSTGWQEAGLHSGILAESIPINQVRKIIESFLRHKQQKAFKHLYSSLSAAPVCKCSAKESVMWLQISAAGSKECHGYSTLGELLRRLHLTGSVWQQGRFNFVINLTELIVQRKLMSLSGTSRNHLYAIIEALVKRVVESNERIRQMKRIIHCLLLNLMRKKNDLIGSKLSWFAEVDLVRKWRTRLNQIKIIQRVDTHLTITDLPVCIQRHIVCMLDDHQDIESLSHVNKTLSELCMEPGVWRNICLNQFTKKQLLECESVLERRRQKRGGDHQTEITWKRKYHFMLKRFENMENYADPLLLCRRCLIVFWQDSGHPCVGTSEEHIVYDRINPKKLISFF